MASFSTGSSLIAVDEIQIASAHSLLTLRRQLLGASSVWSGLETLAGQLRQPEPGDFGFNATRTVENRNRQPAHHLKQASAVRFRDQPNGSRRQPESRRAELMPPPSLQSPTRRTRGWPTARITAGATTGLAVARRGFFRWRINWVRRHRNVPYRSKRALDRRPQRRFHPLWRRCVEPVLDLEDLETTGRGSECGIAALTGRPVDDQQEALAFLDALMEVAGAVAHDGGVGQ